LRRRLLIATWGLGILACIDWWLLRSTSLAHSSWVLAALVAAVLLLLIGLAVDTGIGLQRGRLSRGGALTTLLLVVGCLVLLGAGATNWLFSLQGFVILREGEQVPLYHGSHLEHFQQGPLSRIEEMDLMLGLEKLEVVAADDDFFFPRSHLVARRAEGEPIMMKVDPGTAASVGSLRFYQGAFGFAPRIVILRDGETLLDEVVPFRSRRDGPAGIRFEERFTVSREALVVDGRIDLASLDEGMRGHATLELVVLREGRPLGRGQLLPGHFAEIDQGYRIGFAGLERWSEIDVSRRNYRQVGRVGAVLALLGAILWPVARWRRW
jgi:hypothetical protein